MSDVDVELEEEPGIVIAPNGRRVVVPIEVHLEMTPARVKRVLEDRARNRRRTSETQEV